MSQKNTEQIEKLTLLLSLGLCVALENRSISIDEAEYLLYNPYVMDVLEQLGIPEETIALIHDGLELQDVARIVPEHFGEHFLTMKRDALELLKMRPPCDLSQPKWIGKHLQEGDEDSL